MKHPHRSSRKPAYILLATGLFIILVGGFAIPYAIATQNTYVREGATEAGSPLSFLPKPPPTLDVAAYDRKLFAVANYASTTPTTTPRLWPADAVRPNVGALLPFNRIVAYYGNFYSTRMGILGEFEPDVVLGKLKQEKAKWEAADPATPVVLAIDYIATTAQLHPGEKGYYRLRMPDEHIEKAFTMAEQVDGIVVLEVQAGLAPLQGEIEALGEYLKRPNGHLAIDPEFNMKGGEAPGTVIGTVSAGDVNRAAAYLASLVKEHGLPPKILVVHRFTQRMVTNYEAIEPLPEVQIVMVMDGWGSPAKKLNTYRSFIAPEPVQFTGFKIFYKNDLKPPSERLITPAELLKLTPQPLYIQYQ
ncbi:MAG TPA: hypothetical protein VFY28_02335 [Candidatus Paceibacterota bacterium]|nr:hypothetical protein [Candidatus Paceibacterota bacterium]